MSTKSEDPFGKPPSRIASQGPNGQQSQTSARLPKALFTSQADSKALAAAVMADTADCFSPGAGTHNLLGLRLGGLFGILALSALGVTIPFFAYTAKFETLFFFLRAFASGVVLTTGGRSHCTSCMLSRCWQPTCSVDSTICCLPCLPAGPTVHSCKSSRRIRLVAHAARPFCAGWAELQIFLHFDLIESLPLPFSLRL